LQVLVRKGVLEVAQCLFGFPHSSGMNEHRERLFHSGTEGAGHP
jgi:hypothetical protein